MKFQQLIRAILETSASPSIAVEDDRELTRPRRVGPAKRRMLKKSVGHAVSQRLQPTQSWRFFPGCKPEKRLDASGTL